MKALRVELYQDHVCYRQETGYRFFQSYPLPTPSMVRGLVHRLLGAEKGGFAYIPLKISIQGGYDSLFVDMQRWDKETQKRLGWKEKGHQIMFWEELSGVKLILHIAFKDESLEKLKQLEQAFLANTVVLGRNEDIARVDSIELVDLEENKAKIEITAPLMYCNKSEINTSPVNSAFRLPFAYSIINGSRVFQYVDTFLLSLGNGVKVQYFYKKDIDNKDAIEEPVSFLELSSDAEDKIVGKK